MLPSVPAVVKVMGTAVAEVVVATGTLPKLVGA
jgi:hypothetical protein